MQRNDLTQLKRAVGEAVLRATYGLRRISSAALKKTFIPLSIAALLAVAPAAFAIDFTFSANKTVDAQGVQGTGYVGTTLGSDANIFFNALDKVLTFECAEGELTWSGDITFNKLTGTNSIKIVGANDTSGDPTNDTYVHNFTGKISGSSNLEKLGAGVMVLSGANDYTGSTILNIGVLKVGTQEAADGFGNSSGLSFESGKNAIFDINGFNVTLKGLKSDDGNKSDIITNTGTSDAILTVNLAADNEYNSTIIDGATNKIGLAKLGTSTLTLTGVNTYTGATTISAGTLQLGLGGSIADSASVTMSGTSTLDLAGTATETTVINNLTGAAGNIITRSITDTHTLNAVNTGNTTFAGIINNGSVGGAVGLTKTGDGALNLTGANAYTGLTAVYAGTLQIGNAGAWSSDGSTGIGDYTVAAGAKLAIGYNATGAYNLQTNKNGNGLTVDLSNITLGAGSTLVIGDVSNSNPAEWISKTVTISNTFSGISDAMLEFVVDKNGGTSFLRIEDFNDSGSGGVSATNISVASNVASNFNSFGEKITNDEGTSLYRRLLVGSTDTSDTAGSGAFKLVDSKGDEIKQFSAGRYDFDFVYGTGITTTNGGAYSEAWMLKANLAEVALPDMSTMTLINIIGFELPRAQNVNGPWIRTKLGQINDSKALFDENNYQTVQLGWDKTFDAYCNNGTWNFGMFMEGDWIQGDGNYKSKYGNITGLLDSSTNGMGAGLYASRGFKNGLYADVVGRINLFKNSVNMDAFENPTKSYKADWTNTFFSIAVEVGKDFKSCDKHWTLNPYVRLIYTGAPSQEFDVIFADADNSITNVNVHTVDAWTSKLGGRLTYDAQRKCGWNWLSFVGADYYQGLSGNFGSGMYDKTTGMQQDIIAARPKNDLSYGTATLGATLMPRKNVALTAHGEGLFGDVNGWAIGARAAVSF